jgi:hypothetical protein
MTPFRQRVPLEYRVMWLELRLCGVVVFTDHARHYGSSPDGPQVGEVGRVSGRQRFKVWGRIAIMNQEPQRADPKHLVLMAQHEQLDVLGKSDRTSTASRPNRHLTKR